MPHCLHDRVAAETSGQHAGNRSVTQRLNGHVAGRDAGAVERSVKHSHVGNVSCVHIGPCLHFVRPLEFFGATRESSMVGFRCRVVETKANAAHLTRYTACWVEGHMAPDSTVELVSHGEVGVQGDPLLLRQAVNASGEVIFTTDRQGLITFVNPEFQRTYGYAPAEVIGRTTPRLLKGGLKSADEYREFWRRLASGETVRQQFSNRSRDGRLVSMDATVSPVWDEAHRNIVGFAAIQRDVTAKQQSEDELRHKTALLATEHDASLDGILVVDEHGRVVLFNRQFATVWGLEGELLESGEDGPVLKAAMSKVLDPDGFLAKVQSLYEHRDQTSRDEIALRDGRVLDRYSAPMRSPEGEYFGRVWFFRDITDGKRFETELRQSEARLRHDARHDRLTGLPNRTMLMERLDAAVAAARQGPAPAFDLLFIDLDNFKQVNDSLGHRVGDELLVAFARRLSGAIRAGDTLSRLGGDEFVLLTVGRHDGLAVQELAARIQSALRTPFLLEGRSVVVTASIGIATSEAIGAEDAGDLLRDADTAMYQAKRAGKARSEVFKREMHDEAMQRFELENDLRQAVEHKEFVLHYQPIADALPRKGMRLEALLRWQHRVRGLLRPGDFIHVAEEIGLMIPIGEWALRTACVEGLRWQRAAGRAIRMAVNVSPRQLMTVGFADTVEQIIRETGFNPRHLELELSEETIFEASPGIAETLERLVQAGVRLSVDDFGLVNASIRHLARLPIATVKIDRSIVRDIFEDHAGPVIMQALVALGHGLNLEVIAEGVETIDQKAFLEEHGCDALQGFLISPVLTAAEVEQRLAIVNS